MVNKKRIRSFTIDGIVADDSSLTTNRSKMEKVLDTKIRFDGYVPHLDLDTNYFISYDANREIFNFSLTMFAVYVGKKKSWEIVGITGTKYIYK